MENPSAHKKQLHQTLEEAQRLHNTGDLVGALKAYRQAQKWVSDDKTKDEVQQYIDELHDMVAFVQESDGQHDRTWWESGIEFLKENTFLIVVASITATAVVLLALLIPLVVKSLGTSPSTQATPSPTPLEDRTERGDNYQVQVELKGNNSGSSGTIKKSTSVVTLTIPEVLYEPFPSKYIIHDQTPVYAEIPPADSTLPVTQVPLNTRVLLIDKTDDQRWLRIEVSGGQKYWVQAQHLADDAYKSPQEIDQEIRTALGNKYWEIQVEGNHAPFQYYLYVDAPNARQAYTSMLRAYQSYSERQMLEALNSISHQKTESLRLEEMSSPPAASVNPVVLRLKVFAKSSYGTERLLGEKQFSTAKQEDNRYRSRLLLEGF